MLPSLSGRYVLRIGARRGLVQPTRVPESSLRRAFYITPNACQPRQRNASPSSVLVTVPTSNWRVNSAQSLSPKRFASRSETTLPTGKQVSSTSTTRSVLKEVGQAGAGPVLGPDRDVDMSKSIQGDIKAIRETFALGSVPREAYVLGLAGTLPYFATSLATLFCAWDLNYAAMHGAGYILSDQTAFELLKFLEPIQVGYGAVILSFLGAIHWGLEWAGYGGYHGYRRYSIGVLAPAVAWPTLMLPYEWALATQFLAFTMLYFVDSTAATRGWTPSWYSTYRFVLTFMVGASIVVSLIGRGEIGDHESWKKLPGAVDRIRSEDGGSSMRARHEEEYAKVMDKKAEEQREREEKERAEEKEKEKERQKENNQQEHDDENDETKEDSQGDNDKGDEDES